MATGRARGTRKLKPWLVQQVESGKFPGLVWDDDKKTSFRIPWKHAGKQDFRHDEDAAIFKAWAIYKNKFQSGEKIDAAAWKTRLRCALNKSPEFQELPYRSHLDISEPYKVYRIVPTEEQGLAGSGKVGKVIRKRKGTAQLKDSSSDEEQEEQKRPKLITLELTAVVDVDVTGSVSPEDSGIGSDSNSTETHSIIQHNTEPVIPNPALAAQIINTDMQVTVRYSGVEVSRCLIQSGECKISAAVPPVHTGSLEHVLLPAPEALPEGETRNQTRNLLSFLQSGVMLASNSQGIFAQRQRSCQGRIFWAGPHAQQLTEPNKLDRHTLVKIFDTQNFLAELEIYRAGGGPPPNSHVTLCFGEEILESDTISQKLITAQIEQVIASQLVREASESHFSGQSPSLLLQNTAVLYLSALLPLDIQDGPHEICM